MLKSMRSRMTLQFVLLLIPFLLGTSYMVMMISSRAAETDARKAFDTLKTRALRQMSDNSGKVNPDWKTKLDQLSEGPTFLQNKAGIIVKDYNTDDVLYVSSLNPPPSFFTQSRNSWPKDVFDNYRLTGDRFHKYRITIVAKKKPIESTLPTTLFALSVVVIGAAAVGTWFMVGRVLSPIRKLARQTSTASAEHLTVRLESPSKDAEMRDLVDTLNGLLDRVYETAEMKGRFYAAASHELRTPLQALSGHLELAVSRKRTAEEYEAVVKESYVQARRLISLTQGLLFLHQIDSRTNPSQEPVNLTDACESALEMAQGQLNARNLRLTDSFVDGIYIEAVPSHAEVMARNLIENAVKYATAGGALDVTLRVESEQVILEVVNDFPADVKIATENVFEAFYRDDTSRNSKTGGNGLGLAICRAIAVANGWEVKLFQEGGKIRAVVHFGSIEPKKDPKGKKRHPSAVTRTATA